MLSQLPDDLLVGRRCPEYPGGGPCCGPFGYAGGGGGGGGGEGKPWAGGDGNPDLRRRRREPRFRWWRWEPRRRRWRWEPRWGRWRRLVSRRRVLAQPPPGHRRQFPHRMYGGGAAALRAHRSYLAISHRIIVLSRPARWEDSASEVPRSPEALCRNRPGGIRAVMSFSVFGRISVKSAEPDHGGCNLLTMVGTMIMSAASRVLAKVISRRAGAASQMCPRLPAPQ